ncbi:hypothetical protein ASC77_24010 [Nocardioides sp. Root1257]|uniref:ArnT family glycosyltransferase n=1 Tax=unclassified Nocardioides TaxID=2615069 RepID=UPI0006F685C6|nr:MULTISPECIES: glycosyltransferase family 39 protein [unclassified Nocardioides]KQW52456.1 hypothetical protein ASC77_24010 [Nocardioides sp. Root1257]KRC54519.1 hypothetical protein ASE24_23805 [Nocardioides sp. Root224]
MTTSAAPEAPSTDSTDRRLDRLGWLGVGIITAIVGLSWLPVLDASWGNNHEGRVFARLALQVRNLHELGIRGSDFGTSWVPYASHAYAHHPPMADLLSQLVGALPGETEWQVRLAPYLLGVLALPSAAWLLRELSVRWAPTLLAVGLLASCGLYWVYGRIVWDLGPALAMTAAIVGVARRPDPSRRRLTVAGLLCVFAVTTGWLCVAFAAGLGLWLLLQRRLSRVTIWIGASMVLGVAIILLFVVGIAGAAELGAQTTTRTGNGGLTFGEYLRLEGGRLHDLFPWWSLVLLPAGVVAGLVRRDTRSLMGVLTLIALGWVLLLRQGSTVHDYWMFSLLVPFVVGVGILLDMVWQALPRWRGIAAGVAGAGIALSFPIMAFGHTGTSYVSDPLDGGTLAEAHPPPPGQERAWEVGTLPGRWLAYYWDLPPEAVDPALLRTIPPDDQVFVDGSDLPRWLSPSVLRHPIARQGHYYLVRAEDVRRAVLAPKDRPPRTD